MDLDSARKWFDGLDDMEKMYVIPGIFFERSDLDDFTTRQLYIRCTREMTIESLDLAYARHVEECWERYGIEKAIWETCIKASITRERDLFRSFENKRIWVHFFYYMENKQI